MEIEFDPAKDLANQTKHGISLAAAREMDFSSVRVEPDTRYDYGEPRWRATGLIGTRLYRLAYTMRGTVLRAISLRPANRKEITDHVR